MMTGLNSSELVLYVPTIELEFWQEEWNLPFGEDSEGNLRDDVTIEEGGEDVALQRGGPDEGSVLTGVLGRNRIIITDLYFNRII